LVSDELVAFLKARLDEDEKAAGAATPGPWAALDGGVMSMDDETWPVASTETGQERADRVHIARWDPARVLADVQAKRVVMDWCVKAIAAQREGSTSERTQTWDTATVDALYIATQALVLPYASHPDYRAEWSPNEEATVADDHEVYEWLKTDAPSTRQRTPADIPDEDGVAPSWPECWFCRQPAVTIGFGFAVCGGRSEDQRNCAEQARDLFSRTVQEVNRG
jgi:hypothetical protein